MKAIEIKKLVKWQKPQETIKLKLKLKFNKNRMYKIKANSNISKYYNKIEIILN